MKQPFLFAPWMAVLLLPWIMLTSITAAEQEDPLPTVQLEEETPAVAAEEETDSATAPAEESSTVTREEESSAIVVPEEEEARPPRRSRRPRQRATTIRGAQSERVEIGKDVVVRAGEVVRELVVIAGNARIDGTVQGSLVVVSGSARVNGRVGHDLVTVLGSATLGPEASIGHDTVVVGGPLTIQDGATMGGEQVVVALGPVLPDFVWLQSWLSKGLFLARPFPPGVKWVWVAATICLLLYLAVALIFPRPIHACVRTLEQQPVASFFIGILLFVLLGPLLFLLAVSVAGLLVIPFLVCAVIAAVVFGKIAVYSFAGQQLGRQFHSPDLSLPAVLILGAALFYLIYMVPVLGFAVWGLVTLLGVGAVLLAAFGPFRQEERPVYAMAGGVPGSLGPVPQAPEAGSAPQLAPPPPILGSTDMAFLPRVGFWRRFSATLLDFVLLMLLIRLADSWFLALWAAYHVAMWAWKGTTIGGIIMGIKIVRVDGQPIDFGVALVRCLSSVFSALALFIGFFWAGWDKERQAWHDKIAGTIIVRMPKGVSLI